jgi:hypothetical protein
MLIAGIRDFCCCDLVAFFRGFACVCWRDDRFSPGLRLFVVVIIDACGPDYYCLLGALLMLFPGLRMLVAGRTDVRDPVLCVRQ